MASANKSVPVKAKHLLEYTIDFLKKLEKNNSNTWFKENRDFYEASFLLPAQELVLNLGEELRTISPNIVALPKIDKTIFRLHRDVRFSKDKTPFKTHMGLFFWEPGRHKNESAGYYFHIEKKKLILAAGTYIFPKDILLKYRNVVSNPQKAEELLKLHKSLEKKGYLIGEKTLKKIPRGYQSETATEALLFTGMDVFLEISPVPEDIFKNTEKFCMAHYKKMQPLFQWLVDNLY